MENVNIERAHHSPAVRDPYKETPRPIIVAFFHWEDANTILFQAPKVLKGNPVKAKDGSTLRVFVDQLYSPKVTQERKKAMTKRWQIKQEHPEWTVFIKYSARIFVKSKRMKMINPGFLRIVTFKVLWTSERIMENFVC